MSTSKRISPKDTINPPVTMRPAEALIKKAPMEDVRVNPPEETESENHEITITQQEPRLEVEINVGRTKPLWQETYTHQTVYIHTVLAEHIETLVEALKEEGIRKGAKTLIINNAIKEYLEKEENRRRIRLVTKGKK